MDFPESTATGIQVVLGIVIPMSRTAFLILRHVDFNSQKFSASKLAGNFWELKSTPFRAAEVERHWFIDDIQFWEFKWVMGKSDNQTVKYLYGRSEYFAQ